MRLAERLRARLNRTAGDAPPLRGDVEDLSGQMPAAVLAAITDRPEPGLILTQRPETMARHAGQVALPGGRVDAGDLDAIAAALREAEEEVALPRAAVEVLGTLPPYHTTTGFAVTAVVGVIPPDLRLVPHAREVAAVFEVPLAFALDAPDWTRRELVYQGIARRFYEAEWQGYRIWGVTAAILVNLAARLR